tara:strand:- start:307 stop:603 length:297 start_codon:yes stop_codon:yes gene_type:complete
MKVLKTLFKRHQRQQQSKHQSEQQPEQQSKQKERCIYCQHLVASRYLYFRNLFNGIDINRRKVNGKKPPDKSFKNMECCSRLSKGDYHTVEPYYLIPD